MCNMCNFWYWPLFSEEESLPDKKKRPSDKPAQVGRCAQGHERRFQLGEGENKSWRYDFFFYELTESNLCLLFNMIFCSGERSRTQAELAALREARSTQMEELDPLYSTRQVRNNGQDCLKCRQNLISRSWRRRPGCNVSLRNSGEDPRDPTWDWSES